MTQVKLENKYKYCLNPKLLLSLHGYRMDTGHYSFVNILSEMGLLTLEQNFNKSLLKFIQKKDLGKSGFFYNNHLSIYKCKKNLNHKKNIDILMRRKKWFAFIVRTKYLIFN